MRGPSSRALPFHHLGRELGGLGEVDEVERHGVGSVKRCRSSSSLVTRARSMRWKNAGADSPSLPLALVEGDQPLERLGHAARRDLRGGLREARARFASCRRRPSRSTAARPRRPRRRTLPWKPIVAMWCWPQPFGQPLILMRAPSAAAIEIGPRPQVILEQPAEAARLRDGQAARLGARAAGHVGHRRRFGEAEAGGRQPAVQLAHVADAHPPEHQVLIHRHPHACRRCTRAPARRARASARWSGRRAAPSPSQST